MNRGMISLISTLEKHTEMLHFVAPKSKEDIYFRDSYRMGVMCQWKAREMILGPRQRLRSPWRPKPFLGLPLAYHACPCYMNRGSIFLLSSLLIRID